MKRFKPGDPVYHSRLGFGVIVEEWGCWLDSDPNHGGTELAVNGAGIFEVHFDGAGRRSVNGDTLQPNYRREGRRAEIKSAPVASLAQ
jgi:hypothetical protein